MHSEPKSTQEATDRVIHILDAKYEKADLQKIVTDNCSHLTSKQQTLLLKCLKKFEPLFDGTLGDWKTKPVSFELKKGGHPYYGRASPVPIKLKDLIKKNQKAVQTGGIRVADVVRMGSTLFCNTKEKKYCTFYKCF